MAPKHPPVHVHIVQHDVAQRPQERCPAEVLREDPDVQHVGVGQEDPRLPPQPAALLRRRIPIVGARRDPEPELVHRVDLILGQGLRRVEEQRPGVRIGEQRLGHGQQVAQRLAARGPRRHDHRLPGARGLQGFGLVREQPRDPAPPERLLEQARERARECAVPRGPRGEQPRVDDLVSVLRLAHDLVEQVRGVHACRVRGGAAGRLYPAALLRPLSFGCPRPPPRRVADEVRDRRRDPDAATGHRPPDCLRGP